MAQFYVDGYRTGDPFVEDPQPEAAARGDGLPETADVVIVGAGPAGLVLAAQLAAFPELHTVLVDRREGPLEVGQADGVACRTVEMLEAFGLADRLVAEGYQVNEVTFWRPDPGRPAAITRTGRIQDVEDDLSEMPHLIVNQARLLAHLRGHLERSAARPAPFHGLRVTDVVVDPDGDAPHPVTVTLDHLDDGRTSTIRARYVVGCDGARSAVRTALGRELAGDPMNSSWGVMDVLAVTDFPDIRLKCAIQSASEGSILVIPREGGYLVRLYIELDGLRDQQMVADRSVTPEKLTEVANRVLHPYSIDVREVGWWSVYEIGQRLCDRFDDVPVDHVETRDARVFIAGDACHTHSAKAGQGMNVSMADTWNLGWKLAAVLLGRSEPALLHTYTEERQAVARELIDFDRAFAALFSAPADTVHPEKFQRYFRDQGRFTAGVAVRYAPSVITAADPRQELAEGFEVGTRFHSAPVVRIADAQPMHLGHAARADGAWRLYLFADRAHPAADTSRLRAAGDVLAGPGSPIRRVTPRGADPDAVVDVRAVFQQHHREIAPTDLPAVLLPRKGRHRLIDYEKAFCVDPSEDLFDARGIDRDRGCVVVVRPDQYVAHVLDLDDLAGLAAFLGRILLPA